jgi:hypothetical protein
LPRLLETSGSANVWGSFLGLDLVAVPRYRNKDEFEDHLFCGSVMARHRASTGQITCPSRTIHGVENPQSHPPGEHSAKNLAHIHRNFQAKVAKFNANQNFLSASPFSPKPFVITPSVVNSIGGTIAIHSMAK